MQKLGRKEVFQEVSSNSLEYENLDTNVEIYWVFENYIFVNSNESYLKGINVRGNKFSRISRFFLQNPRNVSWNVSATAKISSREIFKNPYKTSKSA